MPPTSGGGGEPAVNRIFEFTRQRKGNPNPPFIWQIALFELYPTMYINPIKVFGSTCVTLALALSLALALAVRASTLAYHPFVRF